MEDRGRMLRNRILLLVLILSAYAGVYAALNYLVIETREEVSPLIMPVEAERVLPFERPTGLAFDGANLWVSSQMSNQVSRVDPNTGNITGRITSPAKVPGGLAWDGSHLWVADVVSLRIHRVDVASGSSTRSVDAPGNMPMGLTWDGSNLWVSDPTLNKIYQIDPVNGSVLRAFAAPPPASRPSGLAWDGSSLWVADLGTSIVLKVDPSSRTAVSQYYSSGYYPANLAWDGGYLWVLDLNANKVYRTLPGARAYRLLRLSVPTWFLTALGLSILPVVLSIISALRREGEEFVPRDSGAASAPPRRRRAWPLSAAARMIAIAGSIYTSYELIRVIYEVAILGNVVVRGDAPLWLYRSEMILGLYTLIYWVCYAAVRVLRPLLERLAG